MEQNIEILEKIVNDKPVTFIKRPEKPEDDPYPMSSSSYGLYDRHIIEALKKARVRKIIEV